MPFKSYGEKLEALAPVATFDASIFEGDAECPQHVCNLVAALAVAHNDLNDISLGFELRQSLGTVSDEGLTKERGLSGGIGLHLVKLRTSVIHELIVLLGKEKKSVDHPWFQYLISSMHPSNRRHWLTLQEVADGRKGRSPMGVFLAACRDKVAFHYDAKIIGRALRERFSSAEHHPCLSKGIHAGATRFYFADAAVEEAMFPLSSPAKFSTEFGQGRAPLIASMDHALNSVVTRFIEMRRGKLRPVDSEVKN